MSLKDLSSVKLSKLTSEYTDQLKCLECCKYFIAPATASCGHTLCHTCWRGRRTCPLCASSLDRKSLKLNLPLQNLTNHIQTLGEAFEKLFKIQLDEFSLDTPGNLESDKDPVKNVKDWLTSSQNHFSAPVQNSETFSQSQSQQPHNPLEISASNIIIHTDVKKTVSPSNVTKIAHVPPPQDDWDKIETMPDVDIDPKHKENIVGPMDIEPFFINENEYNTNNPRRSSRKRDMKHDDSNHKTHEHCANKHNSRESSFENDKKSQKSKQTWNSVKKMRKEFSKLNKKNRGKLNVSIEMVKKTQNVKPISNTPLITSQQVDTIDENTPENIDKENNVLILNSINPNNDNQDASLCVNINEIGNDKSNLTQSNLENNSVSNSKNTQEINVNNGNCIIRNKVSPELPDHIKISNNLKEEIRMPFIKKSALCPKIVEVTHDEPPSIPEHETISGTSDDIEISIKIGTTITNIVIKKKNDIQVKINTDREVQTSLGPHNLNKSQLPSKDKGDKTLHNTDSNTGETDNQGDQININRSVKAQIGLKVEKSVSEKKNTASAETATAQFEITESVEKELSNVMEYETAEEEKETSKNIDHDSKIQHDDTVQEIQENLESLDELNDLDIFSGSVKEANVHVLKENAPSEILISTVCNKLKTQKHAEKRNRENTEEEPLPINKKAKVTPQHMVKDTSILPDSEPINYDVIMGQVFASIDADMEDIRKSQDTQNVKIAEKTESDLKNKDLSQVGKTQIYKHINHCSSQKQKLNVPENTTEKHSENIFTTFEKYDDHSEGIKNDRIPEQVQELLTPVLCQNLDSSQENQEGSQQKNNLNKKSQDYDDSDRSVVEETPQKDLSFPKAKRTSTSNLSQISLSETKKISSKVSSQNNKSIIILTDTVRESNESDKDISIVEPFGKKFTMETPLTISKFADHIIHKSTPVVRKSLNFDNENEDNDPEQTLCPTSEVIAKTTQEKEFMTKAFESTPTTPMARPQMSRIVTKTNKKFCLAASRLTSDEILKVKIVCAQQKWRYVDNYSKDITHLVVSVDEENKSQRSVKYMCALADSKWIVSFAWIQRCLQTKDVVDEEYFEALDSFGEPGPRRSRIAKQKLFQGINFYCMPPFSVLDVVTLKNMLTAAGGRVVKEIKEVRVTKDSTQPSLLLAEPENTQEDRFIYLALEHSIVPINFEWVLNCLGSYSLGSIQELLLCPSTLLPEATARWPEVLLAQDLE